MITPNDLTNAGISIQERITNVIQYATISDISELSFDDLENDNYSIEEIEETYYDYAESDWYIELPGGDSFILDIEDFRELAENVDSVEEFIKVIKEKHGTSHQLV